MLQKEIERGRPVLAEGSVYELLRRDPRVAFDPDIAHAGLVYDEGTRALLASVHREYLAIARDVGLRPLIFADTWRASAERIERSRFRGLDVNRDNARFMKEIAAESDAGPLVAAYTGPRGDAYRPAEAPSRDDAVRFHAAQIEALEASGLDLIVAATLPSFEEARGIAALLSGGRTPWMLSFVVRAGGTLLDGTPLATAIARIDGEVTHPPVGYSVNCVHPDVFRAAVARAGAARSRVVALQANASSLTPEQLDGAANVEGDEPARWADAMIEACRAQSLAIVGGCCGTSPDHMRALAAAIVGACGSR